MSQIIEKNLSAGSRRIRQLVRNVVEHEVSKSACALAYNLLFTMFPLLLFISNFLGLLELDSAAIDNALRAFMPRDVVEIVSAYLIYVSEMSSKTMLWFSLTFSILFPLRAAKGLMDDVRTAYSLGKPKKPLTYLMRQVILMLILLVVIAMSFLLSTMGKRVLGGIVDTFPILAGLRTHDSLFVIWHYLRFAFVYLFVFLALSLFYAISLDSRRAAHHILPGAFVASIGWLAASMGYSFYVENFANYSAIYGTLGAVIVLMTWLYMTAFVLILGAEVNAVIAD